MLIRLLATIIGIASGILFASTRSLAAEASNAATVLAPFVNDDTLGAIYIDIGSVKITQGVGKIAQQLPAGWGDPQSLMIGGMMADGLLQRMKQAGVEGVYIVGGLGDIRAGGGPIGIATTAPNGDLQKVEQLFRDLVVELGSMAGAAPGKDQQTPAEAFRQRFGFELEVARKGNVVVVGPKLSVERYVALKSLPRKELLEPLEKLVDEGATIAAVFCPGSDYRRVSRELWPQLPGVLAPLRGELADRWLRFDLAVSPDRQQLALVAKDPEAAQIGAQLWHDLPAAADEFDLEQKRLGEFKAAAQLLVNAIPAKTDGAKVVWELPEGEQQLTELRSRLGEAIHGSMESQRQHRRMTQFKQLSLAMLNYESANKHLPPAAICDKDGKPLLSWRVAILPYMDERELYDQFHLDEPWDSPHNRELVKKMPKGFADPDSRLAGLASEGKTTYQVPVGPETVFHNKEGTKYKEIKDGTSSTILMVEVAPEQAVEWTKPVDWEVDLAHPLRRVTRTDRDYFAAARCDGSVMAVPVNSDEAKLRANLTRAGNDDAAGLP
jgi:hypothetical protein